MTTKFLATGLALTGGALWGLVGVRAHALLAAQKPTPETKPPTSVQIVGNVYEPAEQKATPQNMARLKLPPGFQISKWAENLQNPRMIAVAGDGCVYVTRRENGDCLLLRDTNNDGRADKRTVVAKKKWMHGIALRDDQVYLATVNDVYVARRKADGTLGTLRRIISDLPDAGQHPNRTLAFGPDGMLYVSVGSTCNACDEPNEENATMLRVTPDGKKRTIYASGLRNTIGFGWHPVTKNMYGMDHGIDWLGDNDQKEELNRIEKGRRYGWPYIYADGKRNPQDDPPRGITMAQWDAKSRRPELLYTAHSAPLQMAFYPMASYRGHDLYLRGWFPAAYRNDAFVAMRGSWNRKPPSGYEVVRIRFDKTTGEPVAFEPFLTGFLFQRPDGVYAHFARLAGLAVAPDGSLLIGDDTNGVIYRVRYVGGVRKG